MSELLYHNASLVLDTRHIQLADNGTYATTLNNLDNSKGSFSNNGQTIVFKNVDLKNVLGTLYNQYKEFNMRVTSNAFFAPSSQTSGDWGGGVYYISFNNAILVNQTYNHLLGTNMNEAPLFSCSLVQTTANAHATGGTLASNLVSFSPGNNRFTDITIDWRNLRSATGKTALLVGHYVIIIDIFPILESKI